MTLLSLLALESQSRSTMIQTPTVLIVHDDRAVLARLSVKFQGRADVSTAASFEDAKAILTTTPPNVLITGLRLGQYNGLHLIIRSRIDRPTTAGFVILEKPDAALEQEVASHGASCLIYPTEEQKLVSLVLVALERVEG